MNKRNHRIILSTLLIALSVLGISWFISAWAYPIRSMQQSHGVISEITGVIVHVEWNEIEIEANGTEVEVHGPSWFWQRIAIQEGESITTQGVYKMMMGHGEGRHESFIPYQITLHDETYGNVNQGIPVWMQV